MVGKSRLVTVVVMVVDMVERWLIVASNMAGGLMDTDFLMVDDRVNSRG